MIRFTLEYKKTPARAIPVPTAKQRKQQLVSFKRLCKRWGLNKKRDWILPKALTGETGVLKKMTELTMTTTRFTQFPTECVTGDTLANIMYDTCIFKEKKNQIQIEATKSARKKKKKAYLLVCVEAECSNKRLGVDLLNIHTLKPRDFVRDW